METKAFVSLKIHVDRAGQFTAKLSYTIDGLAGFRYQREHIIEGTLEEVFTAVAAILAA